MLYTHDGSGDPPPRVPAPLIRPSQSWRYAVLAMCGNVENNAKTYKFLMRWDQLKDRLARAGQGFLKLSWPAQPGFTYRPLAAARQSSC